MRDARVPKDVRDPRNARIISVDIHGVKSRGFMPLTPRSPPLHRKALGYFDFSGSFSGLFIKAFRTYRLPHLNLLWADFFDLDIIDKDTGTIVVTLIFGIKAESQTGLMSP